MIPAMAAAKVLPDSISRGSRGNTTGQRLSGLILFLRTFSVYNFQLRSMLAILCLAVSISTFMQVLALETGLAARMEEIFSATGADTVTINAGTINLLPNRGGRIVSATSLTLEDMAFLKRENPAITSAEPVSAGPRLVEFRELGDIANVFGASANYVELMNYQLAAGRLIDDLDNRRMSKVAVIGSTLVELLFGNAQEQVISVNGGNEGNEIVGRTIRVGNAPFEIIGILKPKGGSQVGMDQDKLAIIPFLTAQRKVFNRDYLNSILLEVDPAVDREGLGNAIRSQLRQRHGLQAEEDADFELLNAVPGLEMLNFSSWVTSRLFRGFAWLTGTIATVGIVAINYLNMKERQAEIGLRKAVGARWRDIMTMILLESLLSGILGGLAGITTGMTVFYGITILTQWPMALAPLVFVKPFGAAVLLTCLAALVPAWLAAGMQPVDALKRV